MGKVSLAGLNALAEKHPRAFSVFVHWNCFEDRLAIEALSRGGADQLEDEQIERVMREHFKEQQFAGWILGAHVSLFDECLGKGVRPFGATFTDPESEWRVIDADVASAFVHGLSSPLLRKVGLIFMEDSSSLWTAMNFGKPCG